MRARAVGEHARHWLSAHAPLTFSRQMRPPRNQHNSSDGAESVTAVVFHGAARKGLAGCKWPAGRTVSTAALEATTCKIISYDHLRASGGIASSNVKKLYQFAVHLHELYITASDAPGTKVTIWVISLLNTGGFSTQISASNIFWKFNHSSQNIRIWVLKTQIFFHIFISNIQFSIMVYI